MNYIVFFIVLIAACFLIHRVPFIKRSGLGARLLLFLFLFKILAGVLQGYITQLYFPGSDTWLMNDFSYMEYGILQKDPSRFFREIVVSNYNGGGYNNIFGSYGSFWNDLELNLITKGLAPFNFISRGNYYINSILFNFFGFFGHIALFRIFAHTCKGKTLPILAGCFLIPTFLFFSSAIGKDNIAFTLLALFCFALYFFSLGGFTFKRWLWLLFFFLGILLMRNHMALLLVPPAIAFYISLKKRKNPWAVFGIMLVIVVVLIGIVPLLAPGLNPGAIISQKQQDFIALGEANTQIRLSALDPSVAGLVKNLPEAFLHGFFRPYITDATNFFTAAEVAEILLFAGLWLITVYRAARSGAYKCIHPFMLFCITLCCMVFIMNGYIVPNSNTLVRYRSIYLPLLATPMLCSVWGNKQIKFKNI